MRTPEGFIRVVLVDDRSDIQRIVQEILASTDDIRLVGQGANGQEGSELCEQHAPDIVLMDVVMPVMDGVKATRLLHTKYPELKIDVLSNQQAHESVYAKLQNGAVGYLTKSSLAEDLPETIRTAHQGKLVFSPEIGEHLLKPPRPSGDFQLTDREMEVLKILADGLINQQSAIELSISQSTLKYQMANIYRSCRSHTGRPGARRRHEHNLQSVWALV